MQHSACMIGCYMIVFGGVTENGISDDFAVLDVSKPI